MRDTTAFFSFTEVPDPAHHRDYNEWHQLDHRPENLALDGVRWGERWVRTPACAASSHAIPELADTHYVNLYWFRPPADAAIAEWQALAERSFQWGRRPDVRIARRLMMGFFSTVRGYADPRVRVSPDALRFRPSTGIHLTLRRLAEPRAPSAEALAAWYDRSLVPALVEIDGVAGGWTFSSASTTLDPSWSPTPGSTTFEASGDDVGAFGAVLLSLDGAPGPVGERITERWSTLEAERDASLDAVEAPVFSSVLEAIAPWEWAWFDGGPTPGAD